MAVNNFMFLDNETGGLECKENPITQFAGIITDPSLKEVNRFQTYVKPYNDLIITKKALELTMTSMDKINNGLDVKDFVGNMMKFAKMGVAGQGKGKRLPIIVGHNIAFDIAFLIYAFEFCGEVLSDHFDSNNGVINYHDTMKLSQLRWPKLPSDEANGYKLGICCQRAGIKLVDAHGAMADTVACMKLFKYLSGVMSSEKGSVAKDTDLNLESAGEATKQRNFFKF